MRSRVRVTICPCMHERAPAGSTARRGLISGRPAAGHMPGDRHLHLQREMIESPHRDRHGRRSNSGRALALSGGPRAWYKVNYMVQYSRVHLDASFAALSDSTRRGVLEQLGRSDASITDLADRFHMTLTGMRKHVGVLEQAGLVVTEKVGRVRTCRIGARRLEEVEEWIERYHHLWDARFSERDQVIEELRRKEKSDGCKRTT